MPDNKPNIDPPSKDSSTIAQSEQPQELSTTMPGEYGADSTLPPTLNATSSDSNVNVEVRFFGDYELLAEVARGGMGVVYKARQVSLNRIVGLKMILAGELASNDDIKRFRSEAEAAAQLDHPGIVPVFEVGEHSGQHYFSMGFVDGHSLAHALRNGPLKPRDVAELATQICDAVAFAHGHGVIHRDLKPGNVLIDRSGTPRVTDFGLAKRIGTDSGLTRTGQVLGTPAYMPPEQASGKIEEVGFQADVYAIGAVIYAMLVGHPPFQAATPVETILEVLEKEPISVRVLNSRLPRDLDTICMKCLDKDQHRRYQSVEELGCDLRRFLNGEPIKARPVGRVEKVVRWCKRNPVLSSFSALSCLLILAMILGGIFLRRLTTAEQLIASLKHVNTSEVPSVISQLAGYPDLAREELRQVYADSPRDSDPKLHAALALLEEDDSVLPYLKERLLELRASQFPIARELLESHKDELLFDYWAIAVDKDEDPTRRFRAGCALASYDPESETWHDEWLPTFLAEQLVRSPFSELTLWGDCLEPVKKDLATPLGRIYRDPEKGEPYNGFAIYLLTDYFRGDIDALFEMLMDAKPEHFLDVFRACERHQAKFETKLAAELESVMNPPWGDSPVSHKWSEPAGELVSAFEQSGGLVADSFALCQSMDPNRLLAIQNELRACGYRLCRLRPYSHNRHVQVSAVFIRDGRQWQVALGESLDSLTRIDAEYRNDGFLPVDVAGYSDEIDDEGAELYAAVWSRETKSNAGNRLYAGIRGDEHVNFLRELADDGFASQTSLQGFLGVDGEPKYSGITSSIERTENVSWGLSRDEYDQRQYVDRIPGDVDLFTALAPPAGDDIAERLLADSESDLNASPGDQGALRRRGIALYLLGRNDEAVSELEAWTLRQPNDTSAYKRLAILYARKGDRSQATEHLKTYSERVSNSEIDKLHATAVISAHFGEESNSVDLLNQYVKRYSSRAIAFKDAGCAFADVSQAVEKRNPKQSVKYADRAMALISKSVQLGYRPLYSLQNDTDLRVLHNRKDFRELMDQGLSDLRYCGVWKASPDKKGVAVHGLSVQEHLESCRELDSNGYRPVGISATSIFGQVVVASIWHVPSRTDYEQERLLGRRVNTCIASLLLGDSDNWSELANSKDPRVQSRLIDRLSDINELHESIWRRLMFEKDASIRRALILSLKEMEVTVGTGANEPRVVQLLNWFEHDRDAGVHSALHWLLHHWGLQDEIAKIESRLAREPLNESMGWFVNSHGQTYRVFEEPLSFRMGRVDIDTFTVGDPIPHVEHIHHSYALMTHEVTQEQYTKFTQSQAFNRAFTVEADSPMYHVSWFDAARYCNWLSDQEGIPKDEWCYLPNEEGLYSFGMRPADDFLDRRGYRLPTEAEWEYACRAGTLTARHFGESTHLLSEYAWYAGNAEAKNVRRTGALLPNGYGMFDMLGNVNEWCHDTQFWSFQSPKRDSSIPDLGDNATVDGLERVIRGGSYKDASFRLRSSFNDGEAPNYLESSLGFRVARTIH